MGAMTSSTAKNFLQAQSLAEAVPWIEAFCCYVEPTSVLLAIDIDMTLLKPSAAEFRLCNFLKYASLFRELFAELTPSQRDYVQNLALLQTSPQLTEATAVAFINDYRTRGFHVIALTAILSGKIGDEDHIERWRSETLKQLGFQFSEEFRGKFEILLDNMPSHRNYFPIFYRGVLVSNGEGGPTHKGDALLSWLSRSGISPQRIICIDDRPRNLEDISHSLSHRNPRIPFLGIEYRRCLWENAPTDETKIREFWTPLIRRARAEIER